MGVSGSFAGAGGELAPSLGGVDSELGQQLMELRGGLEVGRRLVAKAGRGGGKHLATEPPCYGDLSPCYRPAPRAPPIFLKLLLSK